MSSTRRKYKNDISVKHNNVHLYLQNKEQLNQLVLKEIIIVRADLEQ